MALALFNNYGKTPSTTQTEVKLATPELSLGSIIRDSQCSACGESALSEHTGTLACTNCGANFGCSLDHSAEWRYLQNGEDQSRCGLTTNTLFPESSFATNVAYAYRRSRVYSDIARTMSWISMPYHERSLKNKCDNISHVCSQAGISEALVEYCQQIYSEVLKEYEARPDFKSRRGDKNQGLQAATLFYCLQEESIPKTHKEIARIFHIDTKYVSEGISIFSELMADKYKIKFSKHSDYVETFCTKLKLDESIQKRVLQVADIATSLGLLDSNSVTSGVSGCIYYVAIETALASIKKRDIAKCCDVSIPTITKVCEKLLKHNAQLS